jgi:hypothetical protein
LAKTDGVFLFPHGEMKRPTLHIVIIAALFGIASWITVTLREEFTVAVNAPFVLENVPEGWAVKTPVPQSLQLRFRGNGWRLAGLFLRGNVRLSFSATALPPGSRPLSFNDIAERITVTPGIRLIDVRPESVRVELDRSLRKRVPILLDCAASFRDGYGQVGPTIVSPDSVTLSGAESVLRGIDSWKTERRLFENLKVSVDAAVPLAPPGQYVIEFSASTTRIGITVEPFAEKIFSGIPVDVVDVPVNREVILIPPKIEIVARAGIKQLSSLAPGEFHVIAPFGRILADSTGAIEIDITAPPGVHVVSSRPGHLQYIVRKRL